MRGNVRSWMIALAGTVSGACGGDDSVVVGSKNFTESVILGEIVAQRLEAEGIPVERRLNLGGTFVCHQAIITGQLDVYVEYTGTAFSAVLKRPFESDPDLVRSVVDSIYQQRWELEWLEGLGFNNTFAVIVRGSVARREGLETIADVVQMAGDWEAGFGPEFMDRADGYRGLAEAYGLEFAGRPRVMDLGLTYRALAEGQVDVIVGNSTDGQIRALDLHRLEDNLGYFPPYEAAPVVRREVLERHPEVRDALNSLGGTLDENRMIQLNHAVDVARRDVRDVAAEFLLQIGEN